MKDVCSVLNYLSLERIKSNEIQRPRKSREYVNTNEKYDLQIQQTFSHGKPCLDFRFSSKWLGKGVFLNIGVYKDIISIRFSNELEPTSRIISYENQVDRIASCKARISQASEHFEYLQTLVGKEFVLIPTIHTGIYSIKEIKNNSDCSESETLNNSSEKQC